LRFAACVRCFSQVVSIKENLVVERQEKPEEKNASRLPAWAKTVQVEEHRQHSIRCSFCPPLVAAQSSGAG